MHDCGRWARGGMGPGVPMLQRWRPIGNVVASRRTAMVRIVTALVLLSGLLWAFGANEGVEAAPSPVLLGAFADDASGGGAGIQAGDRVHLIFDAATDAFAVTAANIDAVLPLGGGKTWLDGASAIGGAAWTVTTFLDDTLLVTLSTGSGAPTLATADTVGIAAGTIQDISGINDASAVGITIGDSFDRDSLMVANTSFTPTFATAGASGHVAAVIRGTATSNSVTASSITVTRTGTSVDADTAANGVKIYHDVNDDSALDGGDTLLGSGTFSAGSVTMAISQVFTTGSWDSLLVTLDVASGATATATIGVQLASIAALAVAAPDGVRDVHFPVGPAAFVIAGAAPVILSATANANGAQGSGPQGGDQVVLVFNATTNAPVLAGAQLNTALPLSNGHGWLDGAAAVASAVWSTTTLANDTLTLTLSDTTTPPTVTLADVVAPASLIADVSGNNVASGAVAIGGTFGVDTLTVATTDRAPATATLGATGTALLQLTLTADFNTVFVTSLRVDRIGTAADGDTLASGLKIYDDLDNDGVLDAGEPLLGAGTLLGGAVTIPLAKVVTAGTPENVLAAVDTNVAGTPGNTIGVRMANDSYLTVGAEDVLAPGTFPAQSGTTLLAAPSPVLLSATATDQNGGATGVQAGDQVALIFDRTTNQFAVTAANINATLLLNNGHSWLDGAVGIGSAAWGTTTVANDTLTITLSATTSAPTVSPTDSITIGAGTIRDVTGTNTASGSPPTIGGSFGLDSLTVAMADLAPTLAARGGVDVPFGLATLTAAPNPVLVTAIRVDRTGTATDPDTIANGVKAWADTNANGLVDGPDTLLATGSFSGGNVTLTTAITVTPGTPAGVIFTLSIHTTATLLATIGITQLAAAYYTVAAGDAVLSTNFALASGGATIVAPPPQMTGAVATDASVLGQGIQAGDQVVITFDSATNALPITALNIDNVLALNNGHTWRDATAAIGSALWSTGTNANDTLTITLSTGTLAPTVAPGDTITIPPASIQDATGNSNAVGSPPSLSGDFGADSIIVTPASLSPAVVNVDAGLVLMEALTFTSLTNDAVVTALRIDRLGTATDNATPVNGVHVYHDQDGDRVLDAGEPLLGSGSFLGGTVTITTPLVVLQGIPQSVLIAVTVQGGAGKTIGVALLNTSYVQVAAGDAVGSTNFGIVSTVTTIAGPSPQMTGAVATDVSALGEGVHAGDTVAVVFDGATNSFAVTAASIDGVLTLSSGHSWLDGGGSIGSAVWSTSTFTNDTLTIALTTSVSAPTVAAGDTITIGASSIADITGTNAALGSPPSITGTFGRDTLTVTGTSLAPSQIQPGASGVPLLQLTVTADRNNVALAGFTFTLTGTATASDFATTGLTVVSDVNSSGTFDAGDVTLATAAVSGTSISIPLTLTVVNGTSPALLVIANLAATVVVGRTLGLELTDASAVTVGGADAVTPDGYPIGSTDATIVGLEPVMIAAVALDASSDGGGVQTGDQVVIVFSAATNGFAITAANIEATLALSESHSWLSGSGALVSAVWSAGVAANDTLTLTLSAAGGAPTIAVGDTISIAGSTIADASGIRFAASTPRPMIGSFGEGAETTVGVVVLSGIATAQADSPLTSASAAHRVQVPAAAAGGGRCWWNW